MVSGLSRAITSVAGVVLLSKLLGFVREMVVADKFGTSADYDLFLIAIMLPAIFYGVLNSASFYLLVPYFTRKLDKSGADRVANWRTIWPVINFNLSAALVATIAIVLTAPYLMKIWAADFSPEDFARIVLYSRALAVIAILGTAEAFIRAYLNVRRVYVYPAAGYVVFNIVMISCLFGFYESFGVGAIALAMIIGQLAQVVFLVSRLVGYRPWRGFVPTVFNADARTLLTAGGVLVITEAINRSYFLIDRYFAPSFGEGIISALAYSQVLVTLPDAVVGFAISSVLFPLLSESAVRDDESRFMTLYSRAIVAAVMIAVPLATVFYLSAPELIRVVLQRGVFDAASVAITAKMLRPLAPSIVALFVVSASIRACFSRGWRSAVLLFTVLLFATKFIGTALFSSAFGPSGIPLATTIAQIGFAVALVSIIVKRHSSHHRMTLIANLAKVIAAGLLVAVGLAYFNPAVRIVGNEMSWTAAAARLVLTGLITMATFFGLMGLMGMGKYLRRAGGSA